MKIASFFVLILVFANYQSASISEKNVEQHFNGYLIVKAKYQSVSDGQNSGTHIVENIVFMEDSLEAINLIIELKNSFVPPDAFYIPQIVKTPCREVIPIYDLDQSGYYDNLKLLFPNKDSSFIKTQKHKSANIDFILKKTITTVNLPSKDCYLLLKANFKASPGESLFRKGELFNKAEPNQFLFFYDDSSFSHSYLFSFFY